MSLKLFEDLLWWLLDMTQVWLILIIFWGHIWVEFGSNHEDINFLNVFRASAVDNLFMMHITYDEGESYYHFLYLFVCWYGVARESILSRHHFTKRVLKSCHKVLHGYFKSSTSCSLSSIIWTLPFSVFNLCIIPPSHAHLIFVCFYALKSTSPCAYANEREAVYVYVCVCV